MTGLDYVILAAYLAVVILTGTLFSGRQKSLREFFVAGRNIPWWAAAFSGIATIVSAISYLGAPGQAFRADLTFLQYRLATPLALAVICVVFIPFFHRLELFTAYEYLERRFDLKTRLLASGLFTLFKCAFLGIAIYAPSLVVAQITDLPPAGIVITIGIVTTAYTMLGGMRAVIWTDSLQLLVLLAGLFATAWVILGQVDGGWETVWTVAAERDKLRFFDFSFDFVTELSLWASLFGGTILLFSQYGVDQAELQRFLTTSSVRRSQAAVASAMVFSAFIGFGLFVIGICLFVFYEQHPEKGGFAVAPDRVFPKFMVEELPPGLTGLVLAGVFAAGMSTVSSILHSLSTVTMSDFFGRLKGRPASVGMARTTTIVFGLLCTGFALFADRMGNLLIATAKVNNLFGGPLVAVFLLGMLTRSANGTGTFVAAIIGFGGAFAVATFTKVSWMWYGPFSATLTITAALLLSRWFTPPTEENQQLVYRPNRDRSLAAHRGPDSPARL